MTMPNVMPGTKVVELPAPQFPMLTMMFTDNLTPDSGSTEVTVQWLLSKPHPYVPGVNVVRMFVDRGGVEVYSASVDGRICMRDLIPMARVRLLQETMPLDVFIEELAAAESDDDSDDELEDPDPEPGFNGATAPALPGGQAAS